MSTVSFSPTERLELRKVGPACYPCFSFPVAWALPPCWHLGWNSPSRIPEMCRPAWTYSTRQTIWINRIVYVAFWGELKSSVVPASDVLSLESSSSSDPQSCSWPPFSMLPLESPSEVGDTPNLKDGANNDQQPSEAKRKAAVGKQLGPPCSGFSVCCIVHLLLLPDVLFLLFSIVKLAYSLLTTGFKRSCIGLSKNTKNSNWMAAGVHNE